MQTVKGSTNVSVFFYVTADVGGTNPGEPITGMLFSDLTSASYARQGGARVAITPITLASSSAAHADGGFIQVDATNLPGLYRLDIPDLAVATGVDMVTVGIVPAAAQNAVASPLLVDLITAMRGTDSANTVIPPTEAQMNARTLLAADYFDPAADAVANVTLVDTTNILTGHTAQTGDSFARLGAPAGLTVSADNAAIKSETAAIVLDTNELQTDDVPGLIAALNDISTANVLTQVNAALDTAISELAQAAPTATPTLRTGLMLLYMALRNRLDTNTSGIDELAIYNNAGTKIAKKLLTDDGANYSEAQAISGL